MKRSNPTRSVPHSPRKSRGQWEADTARNTNHRPNPREIAKASKAGRPRIAKPDGSTMMVGSAAPKPPPIGVLYEDLNDLGEDPTPIYGQYPRMLIGKMLPWLRCARHEILHVCSGCLPRGEGIRVDIRPDAQPDFIADGRSLPFADGSHAAVMLDPPYCPEYATSLYGVEYARPSDLLREAARVVRPGGRIVFVHYITPKVPKGAPLRFVKAFGLSTGFDMPMRAVTVFEREQARLL